MISDRELFDGFPPKAYRSRALLDLAEGQRCVRCGAQREGETVPAHYHGKWADLFGKGGSQKCDDFLVADLCGECHFAFDSTTLKAGRWNNEDEKALEFMVCVARTWRRRLHQRRLVLVINKKPRQLEAMP
jgi:hypothetical protein